MRWDSDLSTKDDVFKISNDYIALYARLMVYRYPEFEGFFELKRMKPKRKRFDSAQIKQAREFAQLPQSSFYKVSELCKEPG